VLAAVEATGLPAATVRAVADRNLAESALAAPASGFSGFDRYPELDEKSAILLQRLAGNHALPDGNKRTALLCSILFANLNGYHWLPPLNDEDGGRETAEVVEAAAAGTIPLGALRAWVGERLVPFVVSPPAGEPVHREPLVIYRRSMYVGALPYEDHVLQLGDLRISDVQGFNPASVYVRRISGKADGFSVAEIIISVVGDAYAQEELNAENAEAERYPLGAKEYWRGKLVGRASFADGHVMSDDEFEEYWEEGP
jgi:prophage maintenance system killer protein